MKSARGCAMLIRRISIRIKGLSVSDHFLKITPRDNLPCGVICLSHPSHPLTPLTLSPSHPLTLSPSHPLTQNGISSSFIRDGRVTTLFWNGPLSGESELEKEGSSRLLNLAKVSVNFNLMVSRAP
jgi:hypothetical protein